MKNGQYGDLIDIVQVYQQTDTKLGESVKFTPGRNFTENRTT